MRTLYGGVRIKEKGGAWYVIEGVQNNTVVDTEGAVDTFTAAFINAVADGKTFPCFNDSGPHRSAVLRMAGEKNDIHPH